MENNIKLAEEFAELAHQDQKRKYSGLPYVTHPKRVRDRVLDFYAKEEEACPEEVEIAALLHDTVEDCDVTYQEIVSRFSMKVAVLVYYLTKDIQASKDSNVTHEMAKAAMLEKLKAAPHEALIIKCADRIDNLLDLPDGKLKYRYIEEAFAIAHVCNILNEGFYNPVLSRARRMLSMHASQLSSKAVE